MLNVKPTQQAALTLVADIGGTNARFATAVGLSGDLQRVQTRATAREATLIDAIEHYLRDTEQPRPDAICIAVAGPVVDGRARLTNNEWAICERELADGLQIANTHVLNDFESIAWALPELLRSDCRSLGGPAVELSKPAQRFAVIGPGTGLGAAGLIKTTHGRVPLTTEAGHVGFAPETSLQVMIRDRLAARFDRVSAERLVSGQGVENLYWALSPNNASLSAAEVFDAHLRGSDRVADEAISEFFRILGQVAGDLALALGAFDGVFVAGGIAQRHAALIADSAFRSGFEAKGRHRALLESTPTLLISHDQPGLVGALAAARHYAGAASGEV